MFKTVFKFSWNLVKFIGVLGASLVGLKVAGRSLKKSLDVLADECDNKWNQVREA
jgi:hypothetical protein